MTTTVQKPAEFAASGGSPPQLPPYPAHLVDELAQILADALHEDIKQPQSFGHSATYGAYGRIPTGKRP